MFDFNKQVLRLVVALAKKALLRVSLFLLKVKSKIPLVAAGVAGEEEGSFWLRLKQSGRILKAKA